MIMLLHKTSHKHVRFPWNDIPKFPTFSWPVCITIQYLRYMQ